MFVVAIGMQKGGTGKTTTAICLGGALAVRGKKVLLIDLDPQANETRTLGIEPTTLDTPTVYNLLADSSVKLEETIIQSDYSLDVLPSISTLTLVEPQLAKATGAKILFRRLKELEALGKQDAEWHYDYIIIDCPPSLGGFTINALVAADFVIAPLNCEYYAEQGLNDFLQTVHDVKLDINPALQAPVALLTMYSGIKTHKDVVRNIRELMKKDVFTTVISKRAILTEIGMRGPIQAYAPTSDSAVEYKQLADELENYAKKHDK